MPVSLDNQMVIALSARTLFDLEESHQVFENDGYEAFREYQQAREGEILKPGVAFPLVRKLLALNEEGKDRRVEVILLSRNSADTGLRVFNSIEHYGLSISRATFTNGASRWRYIRGLQADLFLAATETDVAAALQNGCAAATLIPSPSQESGEEDVRIAFDGDAVLFSDEAERIFREQGLPAFLKAEKAAAGQELPGGPFKGFLHALARLQSAFPVESSPIRTALITARNAPAHERVIRTLRAWDVRIDEAHFLGGLDKTPFLEGFQADIFFDDQTGHIDRAQGRIAAGHVPHGVANKDG